MLGATSLCRRSHFARPQPVEEWAPRASASAVLSLSKGPARTYAASSMARAAVSALT
jgi:hypothetical protein